MGASYITFSQLVFGCATKFLNVRLEDLASPEAMILRSTFFQKSAIPPEKAKQFFQKMTISESVLAEKIRESSERPGDDFTLFQAYPLVEIARDIHTCLDPGFLVEKAGRGSSGRFSLNCRASRKIGFFRFGAQSSRFMSTRYYDRAIKRGDVTFPNQIPQRRPRI